jgi:biotin operon repressor
MPSRIVTDIRGVSYPSQADAARALGLNSRTVWKAANLGTLDRVGTGGRHVPVVIDDTHYPSMTEAGRALGISRQAVASRVQNRTAQRAREANT